MKRVIKRTLAILLIFILIYTNGIISITAITNSLFTHATEPNLNMFNNPSQTEENNNSENDNIDFTGTKVELGISNEELSTTLENDVQFTITMFTDKNSYDLFKNPIFILELPECIIETNSIKKEDITILNNKVINELGNEENIFSSLDVQQNEIDGKKVIQISLQGEQKEHSQNLFNNSQIVIPVKLKTSNLLPTRRCNN